MTRSLTTITPRISAKLVAAIPMAIAGRRRVQRPNRCRGVSGLAIVGRPSSNLARSTANSAAEG